MGGWSTAMASWDIARSGSTCTAHSYRLEDAYCLAVTLQREPRAPKDLKGLAQDPKVFVQELESFSEI
ncbi:hypothetical protein GUJ93_ZPchr0012g19922 [Zizania palustris]|uniref:Uncharacterized protein n=1 Tax=Zizania palustris TaxID=103762 RepID=A0A8J5WNZ6_ZIZPA|nr:hypothetical protein GUJ93_ZPchr0012g19922 [Zizania palustris]